MCGTRDNVIMLWDRKKDDEGRDAGKKENGKATGQQKLNPELQKLLDKEEEFVDHLYEGEYAVPLPSVYTCSLLRSRPLC